MRLGEDGNHSILNEQHNPDYLESEDGTPTILVADSDNDRVVEFERDCGDADLGLHAGTPPEECHWDEVWELGENQFNWPRDADRLPNGNTLVTDSLNHRVVEVTPEGEVVWEAGRRGAPTTPSGSSTAPSPTARRCETRASTGASSFQDADANNATAGTGSTGTEGTSFPSGSSGRPPAGPARPSSTRSLRPGGVSQWVKPVWMAPWGFVALVGALALSVGWLLAELVYKPSAGLPSGDLAAVGANGVSAGGRRPGTSRAGTKRPPLLERGTQ